MQITPTLKEFKVTRLAQLAPGDLFFFRLSDKATVAMLVEDPASDGEKAILVLGPGFPDGVTSPCVMARHDVTVISMAKNYLLQLPANANGWTDRAPPDGAACLLVTDASAVFVRALFATDSPGECYTDIASGKIHSTGTGGFQNYGLPPGIRAFAIKWELLTTEAEPRLILKHPLAP
jgi:hypothetical protein